MKFYKEVDEILRKDIARIPIELVMQYNQGHADEAAGGGLVNLYYVKIGR